MFGDSKRVTFPKFKKKVAEIVSYSKWQKEGIGK